MRELAWHIACHPVRARHEEEHLPVARRAGGAPRSWKALHPVRAVLVLAQHVVGDVAQVGAHGGLGSGGVTSLRAVTMRVCCSW